ncbi:MAG: type II toxin-antitoxin system ParD family antitoxin, partial [Reyranella sp.]
MTVKSSISLPDDQHSFAKTLVESGRFPSVSAGSVPVGRKDGQPA